MNCNRVVGVQVRTSLLPLFFCWVFIWYVFFLLLKFVGCLFHRFPLEFHWLLWCLMTLLSCNIRRKNWIIIRQTKYIIKIKKKSINIKINKRDKCAKFVCFFISLVLFFSFFPSTFKSVQEREREKLIDFVAFESC